MTKEGQSLAAAESLGCRARSGFWWPLAPSQPQAPEDEPMTRLPRTPGTAGSVPKHCDQGSGRGRWWTSCDDDSASPWKPPPCLRQTTGPAGQAGVDQKRLWDRFVPRACLPRSSSSCKRHWFCPCAALLGAERGNRSTSLSLRGANNTSAGGRWGFQL